MCQQMFIRFIKDNLKARTKKALRLLCIDTCSGAQSSKLQCLYVLRTVVSGIWSLKYVATVKLCLLQVAQTKQLYHDTLIAGLLQY